MIAVLLQTQAAGRACDHAGEECRVSFPDTGTTTSIRSPEVLNAVPAARGQQETRDPWLRIDDQDAKVPPLLGQPGHGATASLRRQPARIVNGRIEGGHDDVFELICPSRGDHPYLDYSEIPPRLQRLRGPYTMHTGLAAYMEHLGKAA